jgi:hypothetical protein
MICAAGWPSSSVARATSAPDAKKAAAAATPISQRIGFLGLRMFEDTKFSWEISPREV